MRIYRSTLYQRCKKKLLEKTSRYKQKRKIGEDEEEDMGKQGRKKRGKYVRRERIIFRGR